MRAAVILCFAIACGKSADKTPPPAPAEPAGSAVTSPDPATRPTMPAAPTGPGGPTGGPPGSSSPVWMGAVYAPNSTRVRNVVRGSPAEVAKMMIGDQVVSIAGTPVASSDDITQVMNQHQPGDTIDVVTKRGEQTITIKLLVAARPDPLTMQRNALLDKPAPPISFTHLAGPPVAKLSDLKGHVIVLDFWATWCKPCLASMPELDAWHKKLGKKGLVVIGLSAEEPDQIKPFLAEHQVSYTIVGDPDQAVSRDYLVQGLPTTIIVDKAGVVRHIELGFADYVAAEALITDLLTSRTSH